MYRPDPNYRTTGALRSTPTLVDDLTARDVTLPEPVATTRDALAHLDTRLTAARRTDHRGTVLAALGADPDVDITDATVALAAHDILVNVLLQARDDTARRLTRTVTLHADDLCREVRARLFTPAADQLTELTATTAPGVTLEDLTRRQQTKAARLLADLPLTVAAVRNAFTLRRAIYRRSGIGDLTHAVWRHPERIPNLASRYDPDAAFDHTRFLLDGIRAGAELWFPTYTEADTASTEARRAERDAEKAERDAARTAAKARRQRQLTGGDAA